MGMGYANKIINSNIPSIKHDDKYGIYYDYSNIYSDLIKEIELFDYDDNYNPSNTKIDSYEINQQQTQQFKHNLGNIIDNNSVNSPLIDKYCNLRYSTIYKTKIIYQKIEFQKIRLGYSINFQSMLID